jgi:hypothetical protein
MEFSQEFSSSLVRSSLDSVFVLSVVPVELGDTIAPSSNRSLNNSLPSEPGPEVGQMEYLAAQQGCVDQDVQGWTVSGTGFVMLHLDPSFLRLS